MSLFYYNTPIAELPISMCKWWPIIFVLNGIQDGMDWIDLAQDRDQWRALLNTVMNLWIP
jgi:hypothetical protein